MNLVVTTCDKNQHILPAFFHQFNKYWGGEQAITVLGYTKPDFYLPDNVTFYSVGRQEEYPFNKWSNALIKFLQDHPDWDRFILLLEDYFLVRQVNVPLVEMLYAYMGEHRNVLKMDLCAERLYSGGMRDYAYHGPIDLVKSDYTSQYHFSWWPGIWNRDPLLRVMIPDESPHDMELIGTSRLAAYKDEILVLGTRQYPLRNNTVFKYGKTGYNLYDMTDTDIDELKRKGLV